MSIERSSRPPRGWNSYDAYGISICESEAEACLEAFLRKLKPSGYEYFVLDAGWYSNPHPEDASSSGGDGKRVFVDQWGRLNSSPVLFPAGLRHLSDLCHRNGVKFGLHCMRGINGPRIGKEFSVKGCPGISTADIADLDNPCAWAKESYGIRLDRPGAQAYYDSVVEYLATDLEVDFIKLDDVTEYPDEVEAFGKAVEKVSRPILLSLSPGNETWTGNWPVFRNSANMVRITPDIWDNPEGLQIKCDRWAEFESFSGLDCRLDLDMIPIGSLRVNALPGSPEAESVLGASRTSRLTDKEKKVTMTQMALSASPLFFGGDLLSTSENDFKWVTDPDMLECSENDVTGKRIFFSRHLDVRRAVSRKDSQHGWLAVFNRQELISRTVYLSPEELGFSGSDCPKVFRDVWSKEARTFENGSLRVFMEPGDVLFLKY